MIGDAAFQELRQMFAHEQLLFVTELERIWGGKLASQLGGERFGRLPARRENEDRTEVFRERLGHQARPVAANVARDVKIQVVRLDFLERHRPLLMFDQRRHAPEAAQPFDHLLWIGHAAAEQQQLGF